MWLPFVCFFLFVFLFLDLVLVFVSSVSVISRVGDFCVLRFYICIYRYGSSLSVYSTLRRIQAAVSHTISFTVLFFISFFTHKQEDKRQSEVSLTTRSSTDSPTIVYFKLAQLSRRKGHNYADSQDSLTGWISGLLVSWVAESRSERDRRSITVKLSSEAKQFLHSRLLNCLLLFHHDPNKCHDPNILALSEPPTIKKSPLYFHGPIPIHDSVEY